MLDRIKFEEYCFTIWTNLKLNKHTNYQKFENSKLFRRCNGFGFIDMTQFVGISGSVSVVHIDVSSEYTDSMYVSVFGTQFRGFLGWRVIFVECELGQDSWFMWSTKPVALHIPCECVRTHLLIYTLVVYYLLSRLIVLSFVLRFLVMFLVLLLRY